MAFSLKGILSLDNSGFLGSIKQATNSLDGMEKKSASVTSSIGGIALAGAGFIGLSVGIKDTFDTFVTFEKKMSNVKAISGASGEELKQLTEKAKEMGRILPASASEAAEAEANLASAGFNTNEILSAIEGTLYLAQAATVDMATASDITASSLRGFGLEADKANHVADVLALTAARTNAQIVDTGEAMKYVAPVARDAGVSIEETAAMIGLLANAGIKGSQAGTTLRSAFIRFQKPSKEASDLMESMGFHAYDSSGKMKSMSTIVGELKEKTAGMSDEQKDFTVATIFGTEALSGMKVLMNEGKDGIDSLSEAFKNADGASKQMAETQADNVYGAIEDLKGQFETLQINLVTRFAPSIKEAFGAVSDAIPIIGNEIEYLGTMLIENGDIILGLGAVYGAYRATLLITAGLEKGLALAVAGKNLIVGIGTAVMAGYTAVQGGASVSTGILTTATAVLNGVLKANPIGIVVGAVVGLIAILKIAYDRFEGFRNIVDGVWNSLKNFLGIKAEADEASEKKISSGLEEKTETYEGDTGTAFSENANGTSYFTGGISKVNERGGEIQVLPNGTSVIPADRTEQMINSNNTGGIVNHNTFNINVTGMNADELITQLQLRLANI